MLAVEVQNLSHAINNKKILNNINFTLKKDSISCILGPSGSGKTTFLKLIAGLEKAQSGKIIINGEGAPLPKDINLCLFKSFKVFGIPYFSKYLLDP